MLLVSARKIFPFPLNLANCVSSTFLDYACTRQPYCSGVPSKKQRLAENKFFYYTYIIFAYKKKTGDGNESQKKKILQFTI